MQAADMRLWAVRTARAMLGSGGSLHYRKCTPRTCKRARCVSKASTVYERSKTRRQKRHPPTPIHVPTARRAHIQEPLTAARKYSVSLENTKYSSADGAALADACIQCVHGKSSEVGSDSKSDCLSFCSPGFYGQPGTCTPCDVGK